MSRRPVKSILVAGSGIVGLSAALAFERNLPGTKVRLLETPCNPAALADRVPATTPLVHRFHAAIGVDELNMVRSGVALHRLGTRFENWSGSGQAWFSGFERRGYPADGIPFHQVWLREQHRTFEDWSIASALASARRFVHPSEDPSSPLSAFLYGLNLDPDRYREFLNLRARGIERRSGTIAAIEVVDGGMIGAIRLGSGEDLHADLYVDCTGQNALLISRVDRSWERWDAWLPCDRLEFQDALPEELAPSDRVVADQQGWTWTVPLPERTLRIRAGRSGDGIGCGRRANPWVGNVLAIGDAALRVDPLHGAALHLAHSAILRALQLMPGADMQRLELAEYNRQSGLESDRARDFLALHYVRSGHQAPFWRDPGLREMPEGLARSVEQFERRGRLPLFEEECFDQESWLAALIGLGIRPGAIDPLADGIDRVRALVGMDALADRIAAIPQRFPRYAQLHAELSAISGRAG